MEKENNKPFIIRIPLPIFLRLETPMEKAVYTAIYSFTDNGKQDCLAGNRAIANRAGCSSSTIVRLKRILENDRKVIELVGKRKVLGGYVDRIRLSGQLLTSFKAKTRTKKAVHLDSESGSSTTFKRFTTDQIQLKKQLNILTKYSPKEIKLAERIAKWGTERANSPSYKPVEAYKKDILPYIRKLGFKTVEKLWENETSNYRLWQILREKAT